MFANDQNKRKQVIAELKSYTESGDIYKLSNNLNSLLKTPQQRQLINEIKPFIPLKHQVLFESLTTTLSYAQQPMISPPQFDLNNASELKEALSIFDTSNQQKKSNLKFNESVNVYSPIESSRQAKSTQTMVNPNRKSMRQQPAVAPFGKRRVLVKRNSNESFGFKLRGHKPVSVEHVDLNSPAHIAGIYPNDVILSVNDMDVENKTHHYLYDLLQTVGASTVIEVMQKPEYDDMQLANNLAETADSFDLRNPEGKTFKQKVKEVLSPKEKPQLKKILLDYNNTK